MASLQSIRRSAPFWAIVLACAALMAITTGARLSLGLFVRPIAATGISIAAMSLVLAVGQFVWGAVQPLFGLLAGRFGSRRVLAGGGVLLGVGLACAPVFASQAGLMVTLGIVSAAGAGAASFAILVGAAAHRLAPERRAFGAGVISAGGSIGQFVFAPLCQWIIGRFGWATALWTLSASGFATVFLARAATGGPVRIDGAQSAPADSVGAVIRRAFRDRSYVCLHLGFFTCGFHIAFLVTHLPSEVALCGLPAASAGVALGLLGLFNIAGSVSIGWLGGRYRLKVLLAELYVVRAISIVAYLAAPKTLTTLYVFSAALGLTWLATVPPTAGLVGKLFGTRLLSTLFGFTFLSHQTGAFFGAWLGGLVLSRTGSYQWIWYADVALALLAATTNWPIREVKPQPAGALGATA